MSDDTCPTESDWAIALRSDALEALLAHAEWCARCAARIDAGGADDALRPALRAAAAVTDLRPLERGVERAVRRLRRSADPAASSLFGRALPPGPADAPEAVGRYALGRLLGSGGMGDVYESRDPHLGRPVAVKILRRANERALRESFLAEARALAAVRSEHVVAVYEVGADGGVPFLAMELLTGRTLAAALASETLPMAALRRVLRGLARGLAAAHAAGLVHRDVKPANVYLESPGDRVKLIDFGVAQTLGPLALARAGEVAGTPGYMPPEQAAGRAVDARADLYGLGRVLLEMIDGRSDTPADLRRLANRLCAPDPASRPPSAEAVLAELEAPRRHLARRAALFVGLGLMAGGVLWLVAPPTRPAAPPTPAPPTPAPGPAPRPPAEWLSVLAELRALNPAFDGRAVPTLEGRRVVGLKLDTRQVSDIAPLARLRDLSDLEATGRRGDPGQLRDLRPLAGLPLRRVRLDHNPRLADARPLAGGPLEELVAYDCDIADLRPLAGLRLRRLEVSGPAHDLSPLAGMPLRVLSVNDSQVSDLGPLRGMPLTDVQCGNTRVADLAPLRGMRLERLCLTSTAVSDLSPLAGMPLRMLLINTTGVRDLSPLANCPLVRLICDDDIAQSAPVLRRIRTLETINHRPAAEVLK